MVDVYNDNYITNQKKRQAKEEGAMNKQEVIDKLKAAIPKNNIDDYQRGEAAGLNFALLLLAELDEIKRPAVPRYVADFYESIKDDLEDVVYELCVQFYEDEGEPSTNLYRWFDRDDNKPIETLVKMKLFGYEVEKKKLYLASFKDTNQYLGWNEKLGEWFMSGTPFTSGVKQTQETWEGVEIWNNPAFEIKEVEECNQKH